MKSFDEIYEELQSENKNELNSSWEAAKEESKKAKKISVVICIIIDIILLIIFLKRDRNFESFLLIYCAIPVNIMIFGLVSALLRKNYRLYNSKYKEIAINKIMSNFYNNLKYLPDKPIPEYIYREVNYKEDYNIYKSEDYLEGLINNKCNIQIGEVLTQKKEIYKDLKGRTRTRIITIFHGLVSKVSMQKSIRGDLRITQNRTMKFDKKKIEMDSSEFEKYFDVSSSNRIVGMQILTADVMEELIEFQNNTNIKYDIYIKDHELYLRFHCGNMFEVGKLKTDPLDKELLKKYFHMLKFTYNLSNKLIKVIDETML